MALPIVTIAGRPNVGKSTLFNRLAGERVSITDDTAGTTRDRVSRELDFGGKRLELVDTGGIGVVDALDLSEDVERQIRTALEKAALVVFLVDANEGLAPLDRRAAGMIRALGKPVLFVANKCDKKDTGVIYELHALGFGEPRKISAMTGEGVKTLRDEIASLLPEGGGEEARPEIKVAVVGKKNVGKSTLLNFLAGEERVIVSDRPGTTRDSIDVRFEKDGRAFVAIDTAGLGRRGKFKESVDLFSAARTRGTINRADAVIFMLDCTSDISKVDKRIANMIVDEGRPCIISVNKWDLAGGVTTEEYERYLVDHLRQLSFAPVIFTSALGGRNAWDLVGVALELAKKSAKRAPTARVNDAFEEAKEMRQPSSRTGRRPKIYYASQVSVSPPTFAVFVNDEELFDGSYTRFLENFLRERLGFEEVPLRIKYKPHSKETRKRART